MKNDGIKYAVMKKTGGGWYELDKTFDCFLDAMDYLTNGKFIIELVDGSPINAYEIGALK